MSQISLRVNEFFTDQYMRIQFPKTWDVEIVKMAGHNAPALTDTQIEDAFAHPIGTPTIEELARGKNGKIVITCDDLSRPTPAYRVLPFIIAELHRAGVSDSQIFIMCALGTHYPMTAQYFAQKLGWDIVAKYDTVNHNCHYNFTYVGRTSRNNTLDVSTEFAKADLKIVVCGIKQHASAGAGGAGKHVVPGVCSIDTTLWNHNFMPGARGQQKKAPWLIKGNHEREDMQEAGRLAGIDVVVNCNYNSHRALCGLDVGDVDDSWFAAVKRGYQLHSTVPPQQKADIAIVNSYPVGNAPMHWALANDSLKEGGIAVGINDFEPGSDLMHYRQERIEGGRCTTRLDGYPKKSWPVKQAERILCFKPQLTKRHVLNWSDNVEWFTEWRALSNALLEEYQGIDARVVVYPCAALQFNASKYPLVI